jgi:rhamnogalacturonyl hydrolase YesR
MTLHDDGRSASSSASVPRAGLALLLVALAPHTASAAPAAGVRQLRIAERAWAGSSVNVEANSRQTLFTQGVVQYAAFYDAEGALVLARRRLGSDVWETARSTQRGRVVDAHCSISLVVDGAGWLHVAWDHHDSPLRYARSVAPGSLELGAPRAMTGEREGHVSYPQFFRLPDGDLLFLYRDGESGRGRLVLNRYLTREGRWRTVQPDLIDGEGRSSPYWAMVVDSFGTLHLAWNWRDSPDVATNHDLAYARSSDGGSSWERSDGTRYGLPLTATNAEYALRIPQGSNLMNPPAIAADRLGRPIITSYWSPTAGAAPRFHLVRRDGGSWRSTQVPQALGAFTLSGRGTKRPPISRAILLAGPSDTTYLVYRDDGRGGRIVALSPDTADLERWRVTELTEASVGAWEPSFDPVQWQRLGQLQMLVQEVAQRDGNDAEPAPKAGPTPIGSLIWSPRLATLLSPAPGPASFSPASPDAAALRARAVLSLMERAADWQLAHPSSHHPRGWEVSPFYIGLLALDRLAADRRFREAVLRQSEANGWEPHSRAYHADDHCVIQPYLQLYQIYHEPRMIEPSRRRLDQVLAHPSGVPMDWDPPQSQERWTWCDALFMAPMSWLLMGEATGDPRYLEFTNREWWATTERLYNPAVGWYFRDESFLDLREPNGKTIHWSRGNGWVIAGLSRVLSRLPKDHPDHARYRRLYLEMAEAARSAQQADGLWRAGLLDPVAHPAPETSGSSFLTFGLASGINQGLLERERFQPAVYRAWQALAACVTPEGRLEHVQPIGDSPQGFDPHHTDAFGVGAFLLAGSEVYRLAPDAPRKP